jgi:hypothetical protein
VAEDPCKLMAYFEELIGTDALARSIAEVALSISECSTKICTLESRHERWEPSASLFLHYSFQGKPCSL